MLNPVNPPGKNPLPANPGSDIPPAICSAMSAACPAGEAAEELLALVSGEPWSLYLRDRGPLLPSLDSSIFQKRQEASAHLQAMIDALEGEAKSKILLAFRCLDKLNADPSYSPEVLFRTEIIYRGFTDQSKPYDARCRVPNEKLKVEPGIPPMIPNALMDCYYGSEEVANPGGAKCADANSYIRNAIEIKAQELEEEDCAIEMIPGPENELELPTSCCFDEGKCRWYTPNFFATFYRVYRSEQDQKACYQKRCLAAGGEFVDGCNPADYENAVVWPYGSPGNCLWSLYKACCVINGVPTPAATPSSDETSTPDETATPEESPTPDSTPEATPEPEDTETETPTDSPTPLLTPLPTESTSEPTPEPTAEPTEAVTAEPTEAPTSAESPTPDFTAEPTDEVTAEPTEDPTLAESPTPVPDETETAASTVVPTTTPTAGPTVSPTVSPIETATVTITPPNTAHTPYPTPPATIVAPATPTPTLSTALCMLSVEKSCRKPLKKERSCNFTINAKKITNKKPIAKAALTLEKSVDGFTWTKVGSGTTDKRGNESVKVKISAKSNFLFRAKFDTSSAVCTTSGVNVITLK